MKQKTSIDNIGSAAVLLAIVLSTLSGVYTALEQPNPVATAAQANQA
jgi:hypothetical protein